MSLILVAVLGSIVSALVGTFWYSMKTPMGKIHMEYIGFTKLSKEEQDQKIKEAMPHMWKSYLSQFVLSFLTSLFIAYVVLSSGAETYKYAFMIWLAFVVPVIGSALIWGNCDRKIVWAKFFGDIAYNLVVLLVITFVANLIL